MVNQKTKGSNLKRKKKFKDCPERSHYQEYGEAHPIEDKTHVKRLKIRDKDERKEKEISGDEISSEDEPGDTDAVSKLLATFNTNVNTAIDSDDEEDEESDDGTDDGQGDTGSDDFSDGESCDDSPVEADEYHEDNSDHDEDSSRGEDIPHIEMSAKAGKRCKETLNIPETVKEEEEEDEEEDAQQDEDDAFTKHFERNLSSDAAEEVEKSDNWSSCFEEWPTLKRIKVEVPKVEVKQPKLLLLASEESEDTLPNIGAVPRPPRKKNYSLKDNHISKALIENIPLINGSGTSCPSGLTALQKELFAVMLNYSDLYFPEANYERFDEIQTVYAIHALNHILKTRKRVLRHNAKIKKAQIKNAKRDPNQCFRDHGYARPKVLILLPFKHSAYRLIELMCSLLKDKNFEVIKQSRFREDYGPGQNHDPPKSLNRAEDFHEIFKGNSSEDFKIGLKLTKRTLKLYSDFYQSDIIVASPLGLRCLMGSFQLSTAETDFLTSIEIFIIDQADVMMMQNWEHVLVLMEVLNKRPHDIHKLETDLTRIRMWTLDGHASLYRQTVLFSATHIDHNRALFNKCKNFTGRVQVLNPVNDGSVQEVVVAAELVLIRVAGMRDADSRFTFFIKEVLPQYQANRRTGIMVYIPDYCDYVRLVKYLQEDSGVNFTGINEYMAEEMPKLAKIRSVFFDGKRQFLLYTERFHFYRRYRIKGVRHVIFYDLPTYPHFFSEICNLMVAGNQNSRTEKKHIGSNTVSVLYQQSDLTKLVGVLGSQRAAEMIRAKKSIHICVIGS